MELSAVGEMANIGLGHATTALSDLTGRTFNMEIPNVDSVALEQVPSMIGGEEEVAVGVYMPFDGEVDGHIAFLFPWESAKVLWGYLLGTEIEDPSQIDEMAASAMLEVGNIINSSFLNAISNMTDLAMHATPPQVGIDITYSLLSSLVAEAEMQEVVAIAIETKIYTMEAPETNGFFFCIPTQEGLDTLFKKLGIRGAA